MKPNTANAELPGDSGAGEVEWAKGEVSFGTVMEAYGLLSEHPKAREPRQDVPRA